MVYITRKEIFSAAHKLHKAEWSEAQNLDVFGKCANPNWHGHNYSLYVTVKGEVQEETGFVMDLKILSDIINEKVIAHLDHKNVNLDCHFMVGKMASTEVLAVEIWKQLHDAISTHGCALHAIKLQETEKNYVEYFGQ